MTAPSPDTTHSTTLEALERDAVEDQVRHMREEADMIEDEAMECGDLEDQLDAAFEAADLRAAADRLSARHAQRTVSKT